MTATIPQHSDVVKLDLSVGSLLTTLIGGEPHVVFRPAVEKIGLDYSTQLRKLKSRSWANRGLMTTVAEDGKIRDMVTLDTPSFLMWLATVNETRVSEDVRPTLVAYQRETSGAVYGYWTRGGAVNPHATAEQLEDLRELARGWEILAGEGVDYSAREAATILNRDHDIITGQNTLFAYMRTCRMLDRRNRPYASHKEHVVLRMGDEWYDADGELRTGRSQVRVTVKGMSYLHRHLSRPTVAA